MYLYSPLIIFHISPPDSDSWKKTCGMLLSWELAQNVEKLAQKHFPFIFSFAQFNSSREQTSESQKATHRAKRHCIYDCECERAVRQQTATTNTHTLSVSQGEIRKPAMFPVNIMYIFINILIVIERQSSKFHKPISTGEKFLQIKKGVGKEREDEKCTQSLQV